MWTSRRVEALKKEAIRACPVDTRENVRFKGPEARRNFSKVRW